MKTKPSRAIDSNPRQVFANSEIRVGASAQGSALAKTADQVQHDDAKRALRSLATRPAMSGNASRKRQYFELHSIDSDLATILLLGGPYRGKRIREDMDARGLYLVNGQHGEFVYRLLHRMDHGAIAVPFDASEIEVRRHLCMFDVPVAELPQPVVQPMHGARNHSRVAARITSGQEHGLSQQF